MSFFFSTVEASSSVQSMVPAKKKKIDASLSPSLLPATPVMSSRRGASAGAMSPPRATAGLLSAAAAAGGFLEARERENPIRGGASPSPAVALPPLLGPASSSPLPPAGAGAISSS